MRAPRLSIAVLAAVLVVLTAMVIAGCGSDDGDESTTGPEPATTSAKPPPAAPAGATAKACDTHAVDAEALRVTGGSCGEGRKTMFAWQRAESCGVIGDTSRGACSVNSYRCLSLQVDPGLAVSCARSGRSIVFIAKR